MPFESTINMTVNWLMKRHPVKYTGRHGNQPNLADPFPLFQQCVNDNKAYWEDEHGCKPDPKTKTGLAGVRSRAYTNVWRDHIILPALRIYRSKVENASLDTIPEVEYAIKPNEYRKAGCTNMQRGIMGFEIRKFPMPEAELPIDKETVCGQDIKADVQMGDLEDMYNKALEAYIKSISPPVALPVPVKRKAAAKRKAIAPKRKAKRQKGPFMRPRGRPPMGAGGAAKVWNAAVGRWDDAAKRV